MNIWNWFMSSDQGQALTKLPGAEDLAKQALTIDSCNKSIIDGSWPGDLDPTSWF